MVEIMEKMEIRIFTKSNKEEINYLKSILESLSSVRWVCENVKKDVEYEGETYPCNRWLVHAILYNDDFSILVEKLKESKYFYRIIKV